MKVYRKKTNINIEANENVILKNNIIYIAGFEDEINIIRNKNLRIEGSRILILDKNKVNANKIDWTLRNSNKYTDLYESNFKEKDILRREIKIGEKLRKFAFYSKINYFVPTIRIYAYFSSFSTIRQGSDTDDLSQLELEENFMFKKFVELGFNVKVIVSLQTELIVRQGYSIEQYMERIQNLANTIEYFNTKQYKNLEIVIDEYQSRDSILVLDTILLIKSDYLQFDGNNFKYTLFESDKAILQNEILEFDKKFDELYFKNQYLKSSYQIDSSFNFINYVAEIRKNRYLNDHIPY